MKISSVPHNTQGFGARSTARVNLFAAGGGPLSLLVPVMAFLVGMFSPVGVPAQNMTSEDHILYLPGHTQTVEWSEELGKLLFTCDYKSLQGVTPQRGEPCGEEPRLYFSRQDLQNLRYVVFDEAKNQFIYDNSRIIERIYEKFPGLLIVVSSDRVQDYSWVPEPEEQGQFVNVRHPVDPLLYSYYAERAGKLLELGTQIEHARHHEASGPELGRFLKPFENNIFLGFDPVAMEKRGEIRPLAEYALVILPKNPDRTTLIHELLHYLIFQARVRAIRDPARLVQMGVNEGLSDYFYDRTRRKEGERLFPEPSTPETDEELTSYIIRYGQYTTENTDHAAAEEVEIRYFISKYGRELGILTSGIEEHKHTFWRHVEDYENSIETLGSIGRGVLLEPAFSFLKKSPDLIVGNTVIENYYAFEWDDAKQLAREYPKKLLTRPLGKEGSPSYLQRFSQEFLPRPPGR